MEAPKWIKEKRLSDSFKFVECKSFDAYDLVLDENYVLIRVDQNIQMIELAVCNMSHDILVAYRGKCAQDIYLPLLRDGWIKLLDHAAYVGKELKKCELSLLLGVSYVQE